jgi:hypothetical protein
MTRRHIYNLFANFVAAICANDIHYPIAGFK